MLRLLKYNLKDSMKIIWGIFIFSLLNVLFLGHFKSYIYLFHIFISFTMIIGILKILGSYENDLYHKEANLIFTLPISKKNILFSRLIYSFLLMLFVIIINLICFFFLGYIYKLYDPLDIFKVFNVITSRPIAIIILILLIFIKYFELTLIMYFGITLSKIISKNKKRGVLSLIFIVASCYLINFLDNIVKGIFTKNIGYNMRSFNIGEYMYIDLPYIRLNIASVIFNIIICIMLFYIISYMLKKKVNL